MIECQKVRGKRVILFINNKLFTKTTCVCVTVLHVCMKGWRNTYYK